MPRLLILDFDGVCTLTPAELIERHVEPGDSAGAMRGGAQEVVAEAKSKGLLVYVLSNEVDAGLVDTLPLLQAVDRVVLGSDNGIFKPDRRAFQRCLLLSGVQATDAIMVDDGPDNVRVASSLGLAGILFDPNLSDPWEPVKELFDD